MNILHLVSKRHWLLKLDRYRFAVTDLLGAQRSGVGWPDWKTEDSTEHNVQRVCGGMPDVVICYKPLDYPDLGNLPTMRVLTYNEFQTRAKLGWAEIKHAKPHLVVFHHVNDLPAERPASCHARLVHIPHVSDESIFTSTTAPRPIDLLLVGNRNKIVYPLRNQLREILCDLAGEFCCRILPHPGNAFPGAAESVHMHGMATALRNAKIACSCSSVYRYRLSKFPEILSSGALLLSDLPETESEDELRRHLLQVRPDDSASVITGLIRDVLSDSDTIRQRRAAGETYGASYQLGHYVSRLQDQIAHIG